MVGWGGGEANRGVLTEVFNDEEGDVVVVVVAGSVVGIRSLVWLDRCTQGRWIDGIDGMDGWMSVWLERY